MYFRLNAQSAKGGIIHVVWGCQIQSGITSKMQHHQNGNVASVDFRKVLCTRKLWTLTLKHYFLNIQPFSKLCNSFTGATKVNMEKESRERFWKTRWKTVISYVRIQCLFIYLTLLFFLVCSKKKEKDINNYTSIVSFLNDHCSTPWKESGRGWRTSWVWQN